jgi:hypothetical protein
VIRIVPMEWAVECADRIPYGYDYCTTSCEVESDCYPPANPEYSMYYDCVEGGCLYTGCINDQECEGTQGAGVPVVCASTNGDVPRCVRACTTPADCDQGFATSDADNHACENNVCVYLGCNSGEECAAVLVDYPVCR